MSIAKSLLDMDLRKILDPKVWLMIVAISHTLFGSLVPMLKAELGSDDFISASYGLVIGVVLLSIFFFANEEALAKMTGVIAGAVFCWIILLSLISEGGDFQLSAELSPPFIYKFSLNIELAPPLILWGLLSLSGFLNWSDHNQDEHEVSAR